MPDPQPSQPPVRKRAKGRTLGMGPAQIDEAAKVGPDDVSAARKWWAKHVKNTRLKGLLDAKEEGDG